ncbi:MAG TPA: hypothetical protein DHW32_11285 [Ruminococcaceae bacterium]|jgi:transcriptional regulator with XRE-family HTH domain|nr:MAG TPA: repressor protein [Caudoviricetes sp.]HBM31552.1 hypothetical protein [Oscillospiraceae bacterium]HCK51304.1 hypothetical protein [Oscillospiraceae bacterium]
MDINKLIQNIDLLSAQKGVNKTNALAECGAGKNFISNIMKGSDPSIAKVEQVADYYGVSIDYLLGRTTAPELSMQFQTTKEQQLIAAYKAHPELQLAVDKLLGIDEVTVYAAARSSSDQPPHKVKMSKAKIQKALADDSIKDDSDL